MVGTLAMLGVLLATPTSAPAQTPATLVDRIVALVADTAILQTELQEFVFRLQAQGIRVPRERRQIERFLRQALDQKLNEVLLYVHAQRQGITVGESEVNDYVDERLAQIKRQFNSDIEFQQAINAQGLSPAEFRLQLAQQVRTELATQRYLQQRVSEQQVVPIGDEEIEERFEQQRATLGPKPSTVTLRQVIITPGPSDDALLMASERAERILSRARSGEDFATLAQETSDDPGTREDGGSLGWVGEGQLLPEFEEALFGMQAGEISDLVETAVGLHIIKLERIRGNERMARHILIRPEVTDDDIERARRLAENVAEALRAGADIDSLIDLHHDPSERSSLTRFPQDRLPDDYRQMLGGAEIGDVLGPFHLPSAGVPGGGKWVVARIESLDPGGEWTLEDVRESLRAQIQQETVLQRVVDNLREATFTEIREDAVTEMADLYLGQRPVGG